MHKLWDAQTAATGRSIKPYAAISIPSYSMDRVNRTIYRIAWIGKAFLVM